MMYLKIVSEFQVQQPSNVNSKNIITIHVHRTIYTSIESLWLTTKPHIQIRTIDCYLNHKLEPHDQDQL